MNPESVALYLDKLVYQEEIRQKEETLNGLVRAHLEHIPFENLDVFDEKRVPSLKPEELFEKIVAGKRGGYCYELNTLFKELLESLGFSVYGVAARVLWNKTELPPFAHMLLICELDGKKYCCDVGYGGPGPKGLVLLKEGEQVIAGERFYIEKKPPAQAGSTLEVFQICRQSHGEWKPVLWLQDTPFLPQDFKLLNFYCAKNPEILFTRKRVVNLCTRTGSRALMDMELTVRDGDIVRKKVYQNTEELERGLEEEFGICFSFRPEAF